MFHLKNFKTKLSYQRNLQCQVQINIEDTITTRFAKKYTILREYDVTKFKQYTVQAQGHISLWSENRTRCLSMYWHN